MKNNIKNNNKKIFHRSALARFIAIVLPALLLPSCSQQRLSFIITAQYADRPVLIGQYKRPGEKINPAAQGAPFESKQGSEISDFRLDRLSRDILMTNPKKTDIFIIQEIRVSSRTYIDTTLENNSTVIGKIISDQ
ncbi:MAG: hypothetical protein FWG49_03130 [Leptospirales bacterium]|nr:hypothetical protein [Leptospirales bacterium]